MTAAFPLTALYPVGYADTPASFSASNSALDANNDGVGWVFQAANAEAITHVGFRYGLRVGTPPVYVATIEGVSATTGAPDGADVGSTATTFTPPADTTWDATIRWIQLASAFTPTRGQTLALTIRYSSGTVDGSNHSTITRFQHGSSVAHFPYGLTLTAGTWGAPAALPPNFALRTANTRYGSLVLGYYATRTASTVGHRVAAKFILPAGWSSTFKLVGARFWGSSAGAAGKSPVFGLWDASSVIQNIAIDSDQDSGASTAGLLYTLYFNEASLTALDFGGTYYIGLEVADATNGGVLINGYTVSETGDLLMYSGGAAGVCISTWNGSAWADVLAYPRLELIFDDITEPTASGGSNRVYGS